MSYWAATVLTTIVQGLPILGSSLYSYVVGGFGVTGITLIRVFSAHVCLGFILIGLLIIHIYYLHINGSNNPLFSLFGVSDIVFFHSYFSAKDLFSVLFVATITMLGMLLSPDIVVDQDGYLQANVLQTPASIKPEWYFLAYYAVIRCIESKIGGLVVVTRILFFSWLPSSNYSCVYSINRQVIFWGVCVLFIILTYLGLCHPDYPYLDICKVSGVGLL